MPAKEVSVRELRANLKHFLESGEPLIVKNHHTIVAVVLLTDLNRWSPDQRIGGAMFAMGHQLEDVKKKLLAD